jgi:hypothetical protein
MVSDVMQSIWNPGLANLDNDYNMSHCQDQYHRSLGKSDIVKPISYVSLRDLILQ